MPRSCAVETSVATGTILLEKLGTLGLGVVAQERDGPRDGDPLGRPGQLDGPLGIGAAGDQGPLVVLVGPIVADRQRQSAIRPARMPSSRATLTRWPGSLRPAKGIASSSSSSPPGMRKIGTILHCPGNRFDSS